MKLERTEIIAPLQFYNFRDSRNAIEKIEERFLGVKGRSKAR